MKKVLRSSILVLVVILLNVTLASALSLGSSSGEWSNPIGGAYIGYITVGGENQVRWGLDLGNGQSGLGFTGSAALPSMVSPDTEFEIGTLRHFNQPIAGGTAATAVDLTISLDFADPVINTAFTFTLAIDETPNAGTCPYPSSIPCSDKITFPSTFPDLSESYWLNGKYYTLRIVGFRYSPSDPLATEFISDEQQTSSALLYGVLTTPPALEVPVDLKPGSCPNPTNIDKKGVITVAVMGTDTFDATQIDPATVKFSGASPLRWSIEDAGMPYMPFMGKQDAYDCLEYPEDEFGYYDGYPDYVFKFDQQEVVAMLGDVQDGDVLVVNLIGNLREAFGGGLFIGEDVTILINK